MSDYADEFTDLLGAYALDAVDDDERARIDEHLRTCRFCATEVAEHREVAARLSQSGGDAPAGVWDRIAAELSPPAPALRMSFSPDGEVDPLSTSGPVAEAGAGGGAAAHETRPDPAVVVPLARRGRRRTAALLAAAAVVLAALGIGVAVGRMGRDGGGAVEVADGSRAVEVALTGSSRAGAQAVVADDGRGLLVAHDLPVTGADEVYQLWGRVDGVVLSLGTFSADTEVVNFQLDPQRLDRVDLFAVTRERAPGVAASTQEPVLAGTTT